MRSSPSPRPRQSSWSTVLPRTAGSHISCDHDRVIQLFSNVVGNAVKFTPEGGTVVLRAEPDDAMVRFSVADDGPGIALEELPYVFDRYYQARRRNRDGIGLGLSIARGIVEAHGGRIWVESPTAAGRRPRRQRGKSRRDDLLFHPPCAPTITYTYAPFRPGGPHGA